MWINQLRIGARLGMAFGMAVLLMLIIGLVGLSQTLRMNDNTEDIANNWLPSIEVLGNINHQLSSERRMSMRHVLEVDSIGKDKQAALLRGVQNEQLPKLLAEYEKLVNDGEERQLYAAFREKLAAYSKINASLLSLSGDSDANLVESRLLAVGDAGRLFADTMAELDKCIEFNLKGARESTASSRHSYQQALLFSIGVLVAAALFAGVLAWVITRSITRPLVDALSLSQSVAEGDLTRQVTVNSRDEIGELITSLNHMTHNLAQLVSGIRQSTESIVTASSEIAQGNADLSSRTENQAASLQQTAASMQQMDDTVKLNSDNARAANQLALQATSVAGKGGEDVDQVVSTMSAIQESSRRIADIITVIDGIAFQTNILALNAAVEAARAGEQGRGFAVVAGEVRSLAQRSANAAREIKGLITDSVEKVEMGTSQVHGAGQTIQNVVQQVRRVNDLIAEISSSSTEQSQGVSQINSAVTQLDQTTQQNAALVEQTSAAAESLRQQAQQLAHAVSVFRVHA